MKGALADCREAQRPALPHLNHPLRLRKLHRRDLADPPFRHRHAEQPVHAGHGDRVVGGPAAALGSSAVLPAAMPADLRQRLETPWPSASGAPERA